MDVYKLGDLILGKAIAEAKLKEIGLAYKKLSTEISNDVDCRPPGLSIIIVGNDQASKIYVSSKDRACARLGFSGKVYAFPETVTSESIISEINRLNVDPSVHGILIQLPLPAHISSAAVINSVIPEKDVDGISCVNSGMLSNGETPFHIPCTPHGVIELIKSTGKPISGTRSVVIGRSRIVGKPTAILLISEDSTVTVAHSKTSDLKALTLSADILVSAIGRPEFITADYIKNGAIVIDVGINRSNGKLVGDVHTESVLKMASHVTPVPGGVGPMTIAMLMENTFNSWKRFNNIS